jgi:hypothetical protein
MTRSRLAYPSKIERAGVLKGDGPRGPVRSHVIRLGWIEIDGAGVRLTVKGVSRRRPAGRLLMWSLRLPALSVSGRLRGCAL